MARLNEYDAAIRRIRYTAIAGLSVAVLSAGVIMHALGLGHFFQWPHQLVVTLHGCPQDVMDPFSAGLAAHGLLVANMNDPHNKRRPNSFTALYLHPRHNGDLDEEWYNQCDRLTVDSGFNVTRVGRTYTVDEELTFRFPRLGDHVSRHISVGLPIQEELFPLEMWHSDPTQSTGPVTSILKLDVTVRLSERSDYWKETIPQDVACDVPVPDCRRPCRLRGLAACFFGVVCFASGLQASTRTRVLRDQAWGQGNRQPSRRRPTETAECPPPTRRHTSRTSGTAERWRR